MPVDRSQAGAYREPAPYEAIGRFPLRTPPVYRAVSLALFVLVAAAVALLIVGHATHAGGWRATLLIGVLMAIVAVWWTTTGAYRIGGGHAELVVYPDRIEVPGTHAKAVVRLPLATLSFERTPIVVAARVMGIAVGAFQRGEVITLRSGEVTRDLSSLTSRDADFVDRLVGVITSITMTSDQRDMLGHLAPQIATTLVRKEDKAQVRTDLDRRIDAELAELDE